MTCSYHGDIHGETGETITDPVDGSRNDRTDFFGELEIQERNKLHSQHITLDHFVRVKEHQTRLKKHNGANSFSAHFSVKIFAQAIHKDGFGVPTIQGKSNATRIKVMQKIASHFFGWTQCQHSGISTTVTKQPRRISKQQQESEQSRIDLYRGSINKSTMSLSPKKSKSEMHLLKMKTLFASLENEVGKSAEKSEALLKSFLEETKELCETNAFNKSLLTIVSDVVNFHNDDDDDSSDDETPIESITDEKDRQWEIMFRQLRDYRILNGDCKVPLKSAEFPKLATWIKNQKSRFRNIRTGKGAKLKPERVVKLESLGISWGQNFPSQPSWNEMFDKLATYRNQMGDCNVPFNSANPTALAKWTAHQRTEYKRFKRGYDSLLTLDLIKRLNEIDFNWRGRKLSVKKLTESGK